MRKFPHKLVNGEMVPLKNYEISERAAEEADVLQKRIEAHLPAYRYKRENGGLTINNSISIQTDQFTRTNLIGARIRAAADNTYSVRWKTPNGFVTLNAAAIILISNAVADHVQKCFDAEYAVLADIHTFESLAEVEEAFDLAYSEA